MILLKAQIPMNPLFPPEHHIPDGEAHTWPDGRIYVYGSYDTDGDTFYCSGKYHVFSSNDMLTWKDHGVSFTASQGHTPMRRLFAPDCMYKDGKYYLAYCGPGGVEGFAVSEDPGGPFSDAFAVQGADGDAIDPAVLVDDDSSVYYFWGQFSLRGARLTDDLHAIDKNTFDPAMLTEEKDGFHEGACIRKRNGLYYMVYTDTSRGKATSLGYAISKSPLGPYEKKGIIIDNDGCDPETWNNHGSIEPFNGQWYVFYHRSSQGARCNRRMCAEPIRFNADGTIDEVEMTTQGASGPLDAFQPLGAWRACELSGKVYAKPFDRRSPETPYEERLTNVHNDDWAVYRYLNFKGGASVFKAVAGCAVGEGRIEVRLDGRKGPLVATCPIGKTGHWNFTETFSAELTQPVQGIHAVYLHLRGMNGRMFDLESLHFE
ncbi:MAG: family 43 glycosylhydrolase [Candidatus Sumerlaeota bacterium]